MGGFNVSTTPNQHLVWHNYIIYARMYVTLILICSAVSNALPAFTLTVSLSH